MVRSTPSPPTNLSATVNGIIERGVAVTIGLLAILRLSRLFVRMSYLAWQPRTQPAAVWLLTSLTGRAQ
jgi:hypothetical protein